MLEPVDARRDRVPRAGLGMTVRDDPQARRRASRRRAVRSSSGANCTPNRSVPGVIMPPLAITLTRSTPRSTCCAHRRARGVDARRRRHRGSGSGRPGVVSGGPAATMRGSRELRRSRATRVRYRTSPRSRTVVTPAIAWAARLRAIAASRASSSRVPASSRLPGVPGRVPSATRWTCASISPGSTVPPYAVTSHAVGYVVREGLHADDPLALDQDGDTVLAEALAVEARLGLDRPHARAPAGQSTQPSPGGRVGAQLDHLGRLAEPEGRHVAVDRLVLPGAHQVGLVPDARAVAAADPLPVGAPGGEVRVVLVLGEPLEVLERAPVLHVDGAEPELLEAEHPLLRVLAEVLQHPRHPALEAAEVAQRSQRVARLDPRADDEDDEVALHLRCPPALVDLGHGTLLRRRPRFCSRAQPRRNGDQRSGADRDEDEGRQQHQVEAALERLRPARYDGQHGHDRAQHEQHDLAAGGTSVVQRLTARP